MPVIPNQPQRQQRIAQLIKRFTRVFRLWDWELGTNFNIDETAASCIANPEYMKATLNFNLGRIPAGDERAFVIHELTHCHVWELAYLANLFAGDDKVRLEMVRLAEERLTTNLEHIIVALTQDA